LIVKPHHVLYLAGLTTAFVFAFSSLWAHWLADLFALHFAGRPNIQTHEEHWTFVITATLAAAAVWTVAGPLCFKTLRRVGNAAQALEQFNRTLDQTVDCVFMFRPDNLKFSYVNQGAVAQVGYTRRELMRMTPIDIKPEFSEAKFREMIAPLIEGSRRSSTFETVHRHKDGARIPVEVLLQYVAPPGGTPRFVAIVRDIALRKETEAELQRASDKARERNTELQEANARLKSEILERKQAKRMATEAGKRTETILHSIHDAFFAVDRKWRFTYVNPQAEELFGQSQEDLLGKILWVEFPDLAGNFRTRLNNAVKRSQPTVFDEFYAPLGRWYDVRAFPSGDGVTLYLLDTTERKSAEQALSESELSLRAAHDLLFQAIESMSDGFTLYNQDQRLILTNSNFGDQIGKDTASSLIGMRFEEVIRTLAAAGVYGDMEPSSEDWITKRLEWHGVRRTHVQKQSDGRMFLVREFPTPDGGFLVTRTDITEQKKAEEQLQKSEERFRAVVDNSPAKIHIKDMEGRYLLINPLAEKLFGVTEADALGKTSQEIFAGQLANAFRAHDQSVIDSGRPSEQEEVWDEPDGKHSYLTVKFPIFNSAGEMTGIGAIGTDITERKKAEEQLQRSEERFRAVVDNSPTKIHIKDMEGRYLLINPLAEKLFGVTEADALGKTSQEIFAKQLADTFKAHDQAVVESGRPIEQDEVWDEDDGKHSYLTVKFPVFNSAGEMTGIGAIGTDITERKRIEAQLSQSRKMDSLGSLAAGIAHDLNNTLTPVLGLTELVLEDMPVGSRARENLERVLAAGEHGKELVAQILAFSREAAPDRKPLDLCGLIRESLALVRATFPATIDIREDIDEGVPSVLAVPTQVHQILMNLASNAQHAMGMKPGVLTIALKRVDVDEGSAALHEELKPGPHAKLTIGDTGPGMDRGTLGRIFDPFFTTKPVGDGTGMGLSVVHGIVKSHEGAITVSSEPGHGTTVEIYLPLAQSHQSEREPRHAAE